MSATKVSVRSYGTNYIDHVGVTENTPFDIISAMEASFMDNRPMMTPFTPLPLDTPLAARATKCLLRASLAKLAYQAPVNEEYLRLRAKRLHNTAIRNNYGKYGPNEYEKGLIARAKEGTEMTEDRLAATFQGIQAITSFREWTEAMDEPQQLKNYDALEGRTFELPPHKAPHLLMRKKASRKGRKVLSAKIRPSLRQQAEKLGWTPVKVETTGWHQDAFYRITLPDGRSADMSLKEGKHAPKVENYPSKGLRLLATRLGFIKPGEQYKGGDTKILNMMLGEEQIDWVDPKHPTNEDGSPKTQKVWKWLPAYEAELIDYWLANRWQVSVGWRPNPKIMPSQYWAGEDDELTLENPNIIKAKDGTTFEFKPGDAEYRPPLSMSELDYHTLCDVRDLAVEDEDGDIVEFMNEEEEFLTMFPERETDAHFIDFDEYVAAEGEGNYDDDELKLLKECSYNIDRSEAGITMGDLESQQMIRHLGDQIEDATSEMLQAMSELEELQKSEQFDPKAVIEAGDKVEKASKRINRSIRMDYDWNRFIGSQPDHAMVRYWYPSNYSMLYRSLDFHPVVTEIVGASFSPANEVEQPRVVSHDTRPWPLRTFQMTLGQSKQLRRQKVVCQSIIKGRFGLLVREKAAQAEFERAFEQALRA